jgi:hypothetical protein
MFVLYNACIWKYRSTNVGKWEHVLRDLAFSYMHV